MTKVNKLKIIAITTAVLPISAFAYSEGFKGLVERIADQIGILPNFIIGLAIIYFLWNVFQYIQAGGDPKKAEEAGKMITYSLIAIFVMVSVWGLVRVVQNTFDIRNNGVITAPQIPTAQ